MFKDSNDVNEQSVAAFIALGLVAIIALADVIYGLFGNDLTVKEFIFDSLLIYSASALGIAGYKSINGKGK